MKSNDMQRIDVVIPHVDGNAPGFEAQCRLHTGEFTPCHFRDLGELRFVLRSIEKFAPWANVVLVVQSNGHVPAWLNQQAIRVVRHEDFIPHELLPTFHWATIAAHLYRIPGLSEKFVLWEDDVLAGAPVSSGDLFGNDGLLKSGWATTPILFGLGKVLGQYQRNLEETRRALGRVLGRRANAFLYAHAPLPATRKSWAAFHAAAVVDPSFRSTVTRLTRGDEEACPTVDPISMYANWIEARLKGHGNGLRYLLCARGLLGKLLAALLGRSRFSGIRCEKFAVVNDERRMGRHMTRLRRAGTRTGATVFLNVNDEAYDPWTAVRTCDDALTGHKIPAGSNSTLASAGRASINPASVSLLNEALIALFPIRSRYEVDA